MLIAVDIGNTHTIIALFEGELLRANWRTATAAGVTGDEMWMVFRSFMDDAGISPDEIDAMVVGSVVPALTEVLQEVCDLRFGFDPLIVTCDLDLGIGIAVEPPEAAGADRLANAVAAGRKYSVPAIVVDMGTATTFDVIDSDGTYVGGAIAPGVLTGSEELFKRAARLAKVDIRPPEAVIGSTTQSSLQSGIYLGTLAMIDGMITRIIAEMDVEPVVIFTGGLSSLFEEDFTQRGTLDALLTVEGLRMIHERVAG